MSLHKNEYIKGRGAQIITANKFLKQSYAQENIEAIDEEFIESSKTEILFEFPKKIVNPVKSPDVFGDYSMNPYQGCEHGCIYCYARNTHEYWGLSAGLDFERKIIAKPNAPELLEKQFMNPNWQVGPILLSGNTDCYQPVERKLKITRNILEVLLKFKHPVGIITKNSLILRDIDLLKQLAELKLVHVMVSITSLNEEIRLAMEPRTATAKQRLKVIEELNKNEVPCGIMTAPIIPGLNSEEIPELIKAAADCGATAAGMTMVRLNGAIGEIFKNWVYRAFPNRADKIMNQIAEVHGGHINNSRYGTRMRGEGKIAEAIHLLHCTSVKKFLHGRSRFEYNTTAFTRPPKHGQLALF